VREWYGWHFPELSKIITENLTFAKTIKLMGERTNAASTDLSTLLTEEMERDLKEAAQISMGTEVSEEDIEHIIELCDQVISITAYREQLFDYLKNRMIAIAPNLTVLVGELVGARLISHAGSLLNLAKHPASTVQILGAEKALFRALKTKHETPKYGLIYHASLIGQAAPKNKGKISRMLAAKVALSVRYDALGEATADADPELGIEGRRKVETRLKQLEGGVVHKISGTGKGKANQEKYDYKKGNNGTRDTNLYNNSADSTIGTEGTKEKKEKREKKEKKEKETAMEIETPTEVAAEEEKEDKSARKKEKKDKKKRKRESTGGDKSGKKKKEDDE